ncbi:MAG: cell division protein ZipA C-terminal FtsZ-binding domain-containing protein [Nitrosospira sp.]|nr:cell division protein ZipA C-terminal FtsZ-binding domain-containing protein [Nitrosospira sp.]
MDSLSELQISLIAIGIIVVMGVVFFNWAQQRRYRRRAEEAFSQKHDDVLLSSGMSVQDDDRLEPQLGNDAMQEPGNEPEEGLVEPAAEIAAPTPVETPQDPFADRLAAPIEQRPPPANRRSVRSGGAANVEVDYVVDIHPQILALNFSLAEVLQRKFDFGKPARWLGQRDANAPWEEITAEGDGKRGFVNLKGCLQLADRSGPVSELGLSEFRDMAENLATHLKAAANCPDIQEAYAKAVSLDEFCTEVDVMIGVNIISADNSVFTGAKIHVLAEASGFRLGTEGVFHYRGDNGTVLFSLGNHESAPFLANSMRTLTTHGITFLLDVPRIGNGEIVFGQMIHMARTFADALGGIMVDDNRLPLSDNGIRKIRQQLNAIQSAMVSRNIPAGGEVALRLFA